MLAAAPAQAGCTRSIINKSALSAVVSRDGGPWVRIPPHSSQTIRLSEPGSVSFALYCGGSPTGLVPPPDDRTVYRGTFRYMAALDRCYIDMTDGFFTDYLGGGFFGFAPFRDIKPLTLNNPRQGDVIIGPRLDEVCPILERALLRSRY